MEPTVGYRRLLYKISALLTSEERRGLVYIRLYKDREKYKDASTLEVLSRLEASGTFTSANPAGLLAVAKDVKRPDVTKKVRQYLKKREKDLWKGDTTPDATRGESSAEMLSNALGDKLVELLSLVAALTEQCSQESSDSAEPQNRAQTVEDALRTVDSLSEVLGDVKRELGNCRDGTLVSPRHHSASNYARLTPDTESSAIQLPTLQSKVVLPNTPIPRQQPELLTRVRPAIQSQKPVLKLSPLKSPRRPPIAQKPRAKGPPKMVANLPRWEPEDSLPRSEGLKLGISQEQLHFHGNTAPQQTGSSTNPWDVPDGATTECHPDVDADLLDDPDHLYDFVAPPVPARSSSVRIPHQNPTPSPRTRKPGGNSRGDYQFPLALRLRAPVNGAASGRMTSQRGRGGQD